MRNSCTNLLPSSRRRAIRRAYFLRLGVVALLMASLLVIVYAVLLIPAYLYLSNTATAKQAHLEQLKSSLSSADQATLSARLAALSKDADTLVALSDIPSPSNLIRAFLAIERPGVTLSRIAYSGNGGDAGVLTVSGHAVSRDALRRYQLALQAAPFAESVDLPVSAYAKDSDISFSVTITLKKS